MDVDAAEGGHIQYLLGQDAAIGHHGADIRLQLRQLGYRLFLTEIFRLENRQVMLEGHFLHRRSHHFHTAALGTVRLGVNTHHFKSVRQDLF